MLSSSNKEIVFKTKPKNFIIALHDNKSADKDDGPRRWDVKKIQRRAFERGVATEREKSSEKLQKLADLVSQETAAQLQRCTEDRKNIEGFAVRLALEVSSRLTHRILDEREHDAVALVQEVLNEVDAQAKDQILTVKLHPEDQGVILDAAAENNIPLTGVELVADSHVAVGSIHVEGSEVEYYADLIDRMELMRSSLIEESHRV